jgi:hypothetical protein
MRIKISEIRQIIREEIEEAAKKKKPLGGMSKKTAQKMVSKLSDDPGPTFQDIIGFAKGWQARDPEAYAATLMRTAGGEPRRGSSKKNKRVKEGFDPEFLEIMRRGKEQKTDFEMHMPKSKEDKIDYYAKKFAEYYQDKDVMSYASGIDVDLLIRQFEDVAAGYDEYNIMSYPMYKGWTPEDFGKIVELFYKYDDEMQNPAV